MRTQLRQRMEAAQGALRSERSAPSQPSGTGESASATPHRQPPTPPKAPPRDQQGRKLEPRHSNAEEAEAARGGGPPSPTGDSYESSTEAAEEENPARPGTATPWARRTARKTTAARSAALPAAQHVSQAPVGPEAWEPDAMEPGSLPCQSGSGPPPHRATTRATSRPCQRLRLPSPLFPCMAWRRQPWRLTQSHPWLRVAVRRAPTRWLSQRRGSGHHTSNRSAILPSGRHRPSSFFRCSCPGPGAGCHAS